MDITISKGNQLNAEKPIIVFGAGDYGIKTWLNLKKYNRKVTFFMDNDLKKKDTSCCGIKVISLGEREDGWQYIIASKYHWREILSELINVGIKEDDIIIFFSTDTFIALEKNKKEKVFELLEKQKIPNSYMRFDYHIVEHCNLNCKGCLHFSNIATEEYASLDVYEKNLKQMFSIFGSRIEHISLLGGEPLLHPDLVKFIYAAREIFENAEIELITNGLLVKKMDEVFWESLIKTNTKITVTFYPNSQIKYDEIIEILNNHKCLYSINEVNGNEWCKLKLDLCGGSVEYESFAKCPMANTCITLDKNGHLYTCAPAAHMHHFSKKYNVSFRYSKNDYIDIFEETNPDMIFQKLALPKPICRYCQEGTIEDANGWGKSKSRIEEWT